ncbi:MAG: 50S ribosomal protein L18 [Minisyncoccia bacterium]
MKKENKKRKRRVIGTQKRPRLCVFRSKKHIFAQIIDDEKNTTLVSESDIKIKKENKIKKEIEEKIKNMTKKVREAFLVGFFLAQKAKEKNIKKVVFDRRNYKYHGRVKFLAKGARKGGLIF